jgi:hypothetical protein
MQLLHAVSNYLDILAAPVQKGKSNIKAHSITRIKCDGSISVAFSARKLRAASIDVPVVHCGMTTLPRATQRDISRTEQASQPQSISTRRHVPLSATRREAEAGAVTNRTSVSRHVTLSARREAEAGVATTSSSPSRHAALGAAELRDALHT